MRALVTGGAGFLGSHLCEALAKEGHRPRVLLQPGTKPANVAHLSAEIVEGDLTSPTALEEACAKSDIIFHLAALVSDYGPWELFEKVNVHGTRMLLDAAVRAKAKRVVFMSSLAVHPFHGWREANEEAPTEAGTNPYARSKIEGEALVRGFHVDGKLEGVVVRPGFFPFGPRDRTSFAPLAQALEKKIYRQVGTGEAVTCTSYAENLAQGLVLCGTHAKAPGETFILADDGAPSWKELNSEIAGALGVKLPMISVPAGAARFAGDALENAWRLLGRKTAPPLTSYRVRVPLSDSHFSNAKAKEILGFAPKISREEGLARTVAWYRKAQKEKSL